MILLFSKEAKRSKSQQIFAIAALLAGPSLLGT